ncbi:hypothetical protein [Streptomyces sp. NPDC013489]|uniref:hypothetical protein n=1 Tax=Streptomyces sp. NPDC013489 TaxID=3155606 RepID=UPI0033FAC42C
MYAHTTWPPPGGTTGTPTGAPHRADACAVHRSPHRPDAGISNRSPRRATTAPGSLGRWSR